MSRVEVMAIQAINQAVNHQPRLTTHDNGIFHKMRRNEYHDIIEANLAYPPRRPIHAEE